MTRPSTLPWLLVVLLLGLAALVADDARGARGEAARLRRSLDSLATVSARVDTVYAVQRDTLWRRIARTDTLTATVEVWKRDTLRVVEYVTRADSAIRACVATVLTCEERVALRDQRLAKLDSLNRNTERRLRAERGKRLRDLLLGVGAGYLAGRLAPE
jgi:hypothetical protein